MSGLHEGDAFAELIDHARNGTPIAHPVFVLRALLSLQAERNFLRKLVVQERTANQAMSGRPDYFALSDAEVFLETSLIDFRRDFDVTAFYPPFAELASK